MSIGSFIYYKHTYEESVIYDASSDIIQIFINNSDDFDEFVSKFYGHHLWSDYYNDTYDKDFCHDKEFKKYLTDEPDTARVCCFCNIQTAAADIPADPGIFPRVLQQESHPIKFLPV